MLTFKEFEEEFYFYLTNKNKINKVSFFETTFNKNINLVMPEIGDTDDFVQVFEAASYLCAKTAEMAILEVVRPTFNRVWVSSLELKGELQTNLPEHLNSIVIEMMNGCETAVEKYLSSNSEDTKQLLLEISYITEMLVKKYKIYDMHVEGYLNSEIAFPSEVYNYANSIVLKELEMSGYKVLGYEPNFNSPVNMVLEYNNEKLAILECVTVDPIKARFLPYLRNSLKELAKKDNAVACVLSVMVSSKNEDARSKGVLPLRGENSVRRTEIIRL